MGSPKPKNDTHQSAKKGIEIGSISRRVFLAGLVVVSSGCQNLVKRGQSPDEDIVTVAQSDTRYVASVCKMAGLRGKKIEGIALITQLKDTGSAAKPGELRNRLERDLERLNLDVKVDTLLESKDKSRSILA